MLAVNDLTGLWTRSLLAWPDGGRDVTTEVGWLQGPNLFADLRQPPEIKDIFGHVASIENLTMDDCLRLAGQQAFAGLFKTKQDYFEWERRIDYQPAAGAIDAGRLYWQGDVLIEEGLQQAYIEHWHRDPVLSVTPCAAYGLKDETDGRWGCIIRTGDMFMYARDRRDALTQGTLHEAVSGAGDIIAARAMVDLEVSFGLITARGWRIERSTLPFRAGKILIRKQRAGRLDVGYDGDILGHAWTITNAEGNEVAFSKNSRVRDISPRRTATRF